MYEWIEMSLYELGRSIGKKSRPFYHLEGASREMLYIVVTTDSNGDKPIYAKQLMALLQEAVSLYLGDDTVENIIRELILENVSIDVERAEKLLNYFKEPSIEDTREVMKGMISI